MKFLSLLLMITVAFACQTRKYRGETQLEHTVEQVTAAAAPEQWLETTPEEYIRKNGLKATTVYYDAANPLIQRLELTLKTIHERLIKKGIISASVPQPRFIIKKDDSVNASMGASLACFDVPLIPVQTKETHEILTMDGNPAIANPNEISDYDPSAERQSAAKLCASGVNFKADRTRLAKFVELFNSRTIEADVFNGVPAFLSKLFNDLYKKEYGCRMDLQPDGLHVSDSCYAQSSLSPNAAGKKIGLYINDNIMHINKGLIALAQKEEELISSMAHELGHYYKAEAWRPARYANYFYTSPESPAPGKPKRLSSQEAMEAAYNVRQQLGSYYRSIVGAKLSPQGAVKLITGPGLRTDNFATKLNSACTNSRDGVFSKTCVTEPECQTFIEDYHKNIKQLGIFPHEDATPTSSKYYLRLEAEFFACAAAAKLQSKASHPDGTYTTSFLDMLNYLFPSEVYPSGTDGSFLDAVQALDAIYRKADQVAEDSYKNAAKFQLEWYTNEQEADDVSLEIMALLGIEPKIAVAAMWQEFQWYDDKQTEQRSSIYSDATLWRDEFKWSFKKCQDVAKAGWKINDLPVRTVPLGNMTEPHHDACFRLFNLEREIKAHGDQYYPLGETYPMAKNWKELVGSL